MIIYVKLDIERDDGPAQSKDSVHEALESELDALSITAQDDRHDDESSYTVTVTGIGGTIEELQESAKLRAKQVRR